MHVKGQLATTSAAGGPTSSAAKSSTATSKARPRRCGRWASGSGIALPSWSRPSSPPTSTRPWRSTAARTTRHIDAAAPPHQHSHDALPLIRIRQHSTARAARPARAAALDRPGPANWSAPRLTARLCQLAALDRPHRASRSAPRSSRKIRNLNGAWLGARKVNSPGASMNYAAPFGQVWASCAALKSRDSRAEHSCAVRRRCRDSDCPLPTVVAGLSATQWSGSETLLSKPGPHRICRRHPGSRSLFCKFDKLRSVPSISMRLNRLRKPRMSPAQRSKFRAAARSTNPPCRSCCSVLHEAGCSR